MIVLVPNTLEVVAFEYPKTPEEAVGTDFAAVHRLYGSGSSEALFGRHLTTPTPWPRAGRLKHVPSYDKDLVHQAIENPNLTQVDPRFLHATQPSVTSPGVNYYMSDEYQKTGRTFADMDRPGNRTPLVYTDCSGRNKLLSGHHRATAALLNGKQFEANVVREENC